MFVFIAYLILWSIYQQSSSFQKLIWSREFQQLLLSVDTQLLDVSSLFFLNSSLICWNNGRDQFFMCHLQFALVHCFKLFRILLDWQANHCIRTVSCFFFFLVWTTHHRVCWNKNREKLKRKTLYTVLITIQDQFNWRKWWAMRKSTTITAIKTFFSLSILMNILRTQFHGFSIFFSRSVIQINSKEFFIKYE